MFDLFLLVWRFQAAHPFRIYWQNFISKHKYKHAQANNRKAESHSVEGFRNVGFSVYFVWRETFNHLILSRHSYHPHTEKEKVSEKEKRLVCHEMIVDVIARSPARFIHQINCCSLAWWRFCRFVTECRTSNRNHRLLPLMKYWPKWK